jgi:3-methylcrotonyl-CoA carboxylase alpha subunit
VTVDYLADGWCIAVGDQQATAQLAEQHGYDLGIKLGDHMVRGTVRRDGDALHVFSGGQHVVLSYNDPMAHAGEAEAEGGRLTAPMPGKVVAVLVTKAQEVKKGDPLVIMEAMKMEHTIAAPRDGVVEDILYAVGDQVADGAPLLAFKTA